MTDRTSFYPELAKKIAPARGQARRPAARPRRRLDDAHRRRAPDPQGPRPAVRLRDADAEAAPRKAHRSRASSPSRSSCPWRSSRDLVFGGWDIFTDNAYEAATKAGVLSAEMLSRRSAPELESVRPMSAVFERSWVKNLDGPNVKKGADEDGPRRGARPGHRGLPQVLGRRARRHGLVRLDRGLRAAEAGPRDARRVREGPQGELARHPALDDLRLRRDRERHAVRQRRAEPLGRRPRAHGDGAARGASRSPARTSRPARPS